MKEGRRHQLVGFAIAAVLVIAVSYFGYRVLRYRRTAISITSPRGFVDRASERIGPPGQQGPIVVRGKTAGRQVAKTGAIPYQIARAGRSVDSIYGPVFGALALSADQAARIKGLLVDRSLVVDDLEDFAGQLDAPEYKAVIANAYANIDSEMETCLDADSNRRVKQVIVLAESRYLSAVENTIGKQLQSQQAPLSAGQLLALTQMIYQVTGGRGDSVGRADRGPIDPATNLSRQDDVILRKASDFLSPTQLRALQQQLTRWNGKII